MYHIWAGQLDLFLLNQVWEFWLAQEKHDVTRLVFVFFYFWYLITFEIGLCY